MIKRGGSLATVPSSDLAKAATLIRATLRPVRPSAIPEMLARCDAVTKARETDAVDLAARATVFAEDLAEYPADVLDEAFREWRRTEVFRPSLADIRSRAEALVTPRRDLAAIVRAEIDRRAGHSDRQS